MERAQHPDNLALLVVQAAATRDSRGRLIDCYGVTISVADDGHALWIGDEVPDPTADALLAAFAGSPPPETPGDPPPALAACERVFASVGEPLPRAAGPSYVFLADTGFACDAAIIVPGSDAIAALRGANPGNWLPIEWDELLAGRLGPWAIALHDGHAASICHTPGPFTARAAECGVWTDPRFRGRGYAAATVAAWAALLRAPGRQLFYSTSDGNRSSQRVAARLRLREIGWTWRLHRARVEPDPAAHPLSSLARRPARRV